MYRVSSFWRVAAVPVALSISNSRYPVHTHCAPAHAAHSHRASQQRADHTHKDTHSHKADHKDNTPQKKYHTKAPAVFSAATYPANDPSEDRVVLPGKFDKHSAWSLGGVFDGHGGWQVAHFASTALAPALLLAIESVEPSDEMALDEAILLSFAYIEKQVMEQVRPAFKMGFGEVAKVGSCVLLALRRDDHLVLVNCGDCRAVLGSSPGGGGAGGGGGVGVGAMVSARITRDHNARVPLEQLRLMQDHPDEDPASLWRCKSPRACYVKGRLQLTRALGDLYLKYDEFNGTKEGHRSGGRHIPAPYSPPYVSYQPEVHHITLDKSKDRFVILATDGLWDYLGDQVAVDVVAKCMEELGSSGGDGGGGGMEAVAAEASRRLVTKALEVAAEEAGMSTEQMLALPPGRHRRSRHDDTTAVVLFF